MRFAERHVHQLTVTFLVAPAGETYLTAVPVARVRGALDEQSAPLALVLVEQIEHTRHFGVGRGQGVEAQFFGTAGESHFELGFSPRQRRCQAVAELFDKSVGRNHFAKTSNSAIRLCCQLGNFHPKKRNVFFRLKNENSHLLPMLYIFKKIVEKFATKNSMRLPLSHPKRKRALQKILHQGHIKRTD
jgi:hypothetical protein